MISKKKNISLLIVMMIILNSFFPIVSLASGEKKQDEVEVMNQDKGEIEDNSLLDDKEDKTDIDKDEVNDFENLESIEGEEKNQLSDNREELPGEPERENNLLKDGVSNKFNGNIYLEYGGLQGGDGSKERPFNNTQELNEHIEDLPDYILENIYVIKGVALEDLNEDSNYEEFIKIDINKISQYGLNIEGLSKDKAILPSILIASENNSLRGYPNKNISLNNLEIIEYIDDNLIEYGSIFIESDIEVRGKLTIKDSKLGHIDIGGSVVYDIDLENLELIQELDSREGSSYYGSLDISSDREGKGKISIKDSKLGLIDIEGLVVYDIDLENLQLIEVSSEESLCYGFIDISSEDYLYNNRDLARQPRGSLFARDSILGDIFIGGLLVYDLALENVDLKECEDYSEDLLNYGSIDISSDREGKGKISIKDSNLGSIVIFGLVAYDLELEDVGLIESEVFNGASLEHGAIDISSDIDARASMIIKNSQLGFIDIDGLIYDLDLEGSDTKLEGEFPGICICIDPENKELKSKTSPHIVMDGISNKDFAININGRDFFEDSIDICIYDLSIKNMDEINLKDISYIRCDPNLNKPKFNLENIKRLNIIEGTKDICSLEIGLKNINEVNISSIIDICSSDIRVSNSKLNFNEEVMLNLIKRNTVEHGDSLNSKLEITDSIINKSADNIEIKNYDLKYDRNLFDFKSDNEYAMSDYHIEGSNLLSTNSKYINDKTKYLSFEIEDSNIELVNNTLVGLLIDRLSIDEYSSNNDFKSEIRLYNNILDLDLLGDYHDLNKDKLEVSSNIFTSDGELTSGNKVIVLEGLKLSDKYRPKEGSPVIDSGENKYIEELERIQLDYDKNPRILGKSVDIGAYEMLEEAEEPERPEKPEEPEKPERPEKPEEPEKPEKPKEPEKPKKPTDPIEVPERPMEIYPNLTEEDQDKIEKELNLEDHMAYLQGYPDETVRPEANVSREEVAAIYFRLLNPEFRDMFRSNDIDYKDFPEGRWSRKHVATLSRAGILEGYEDGTFRHGNSITRAELATVIARFRLSEYDGETKFKDIQGHWAEESINAIADIGWMNGYEDGSFRPDDFITRAELVRATNKLLLRLVDRDGFLEDLDIIYKDLDPEKWYYEDIIEASYGHDYKRLESGKEKWTKLINIDVEM